MPYKLIINGYEPPVVSEGGYSVTPNRIWSKNTARSATGKLHGDIVTTKYTVKCKWERMKQADVTNISKAVSPAFFSVTFYDEKDIKQTKTFYCADITYNLKKVTKYGNIYTDLSIELIEQ